MLCDLCLVSFNRSGFMMALSFGWGAIDGLAVSADLEPIYSLSLHSLSSWTGAVLDNHAPKRGVVATVATTWLQRPLMEAPPSKPQFSVG